MDRDLIVSRVFDMMGVDQDEIVIAWLPLRRGFHGYWTEPNLADGDMPSMSVDKCTIGLNDLALFTERELVRTVSHEIQHYLQWLQCRIRIASNVATRQRVMFWNDQEMPVYNDPSPETYALYRNSPWEREARQVEDEAWGLYCETYLDMVA